MEHACAELAFRQGEAQGLLSVCEVLLEEHDDLLRVSSHVVTRRYTSLHVVVRIYTSLHVVTRCYA